MRIPYCCRTITILIKQKSLGFVGLPKTSVRNHEDVRHINFSTFPLLLRNMHNVRGRKTNASLRLLQSRFTKILRNPILTQWWNCQLNINSAMRRSYCTIVKPLPYGSRATAVMQPYNLTLMKLDGITEAHACLLP